MDLIDLHVHTYASDADVNLTPEKVVKLAKENNIKAIAITDHDTVLAVDKAVKAGKKLGVEVVPGVEVSLYEGNFEIHVIGYYPDYKDPGFVKVLDRQSKGRDERMKEILKRLNKQGIDITFDYMRKKVKGAYVSKVHIAWEMIKRGYAEKLKPAIKKIDSMGVPYSDFSKYLLDVKSGIEFLRKFNAVTVLAHPEVIKMYGKEEEKFIKKLVGYGLLGMEVYTWKHDEKATKRYEKLADKFGLIMTGGTDFHAHNPKVKIGVHDGSLKIPYRLLDGIKKVKAEIS